MLVKKVKEWGKRNYIQIILWMIFICLFGIRIFYLDADLPYYGKTGYQQIDEGAYSYLALNKLNYGVINPDNIVKRVNQYTAPHLRTNFIGNLFTYIGLEVLGDNYYGLRIGSTACMFINFILLFVILKSIRTQFKNDKKILNDNFMIWGVMYYLAFDFMFTVASRVVEPSIYRMLFLEIILLIYFKIPEQKIWKYFLLGLIAVFSVFGIYITNLFIVIACIITIMFTTFKIGIKKASIAMISFGVGGLTSLITCNLYYESFWKTNVVSNTLLAMSNFSEQVEYQTSLSIRRIIKIVLNFFGSNFNIYNIGILFCVLVSIPILIVWIIKRKDDKAFLCIALYITYFLQTLYSEDFVLRKYILIVPATICIIFYAIYICYTNRATYNLKKYYTFSVIYVNTCALSLFSVLIYRTMLIDDDSLFDFSRLDRLIILCWGTICILIVSTLVILILSDKDISLLKKRIRYYIIGMLCFGMINTYMTVRYVYTNHTYGDKETMIAINNIHMNSKYVIGNYFLGFTLYNDYVPVVNYYEEMKDMLVSDSTLYYFDYSTNFASEEYINSILQDTDYRLILEKEFERKTSTLGTVRNVALYRVGKIKHKNAEKHYSHK